MKNGETIEKSPRDVLDYTFRWKSWLDKEGDSIASSAFTVDGGITVDSDASTLDTATAFISGGQDGCTYKVTNKIVTDNSTARTKEGYIFIKVVDPDVNKQKAYS